MCRSIYCVYRYTFVFSVSTRVKIKTDVLRKYRKKNENEISLNRGKYIYFDFLVDNIHATNFHI